MKNKQSLRHVNYEQLGYQTMMETRSVERAKGICGLHVHALADELQPDLVRCQTESDELRLRGQALCAHLYQRPIPASDAAMIGLNIMLWFLVLLCGVTFIASAASHGLTFHFFGWSVPLSVAVGLTLTALAAAVGHQIYEKVLLTRPVLQSLVAVASFALCFWGLFQLAEARSTMTGVLSTARQTESFVDEGTSPDISTNEPAQKSDESPQDRVRQLLGEAVVKIMLATDLILGMLLGLVAAIRTGHDFAAWRHLKKLKVTLARLDEAHNTLVATLEVAKKKCMAGILRGAHFESAHHVPYFQMLSTILLFVLGAGSVAMAQDDIRRQEAILIDASGSVANKGNVSGSFDEYLVGSKRLLSTEPPNSRVWVQVITTDSFGGVQTLVKGWTPSAQGVFTDDLERARHQLVKNFESKSSGLAPVAAATDITGGLWRAKASLESTGNTARLSKDIFIFSDMVNEIRGFVMPALLPTGAERMLEVAKAKGLVVPLSGYRVHVYGASTTGLSPQMWNTIKAFWTMYFRAAGAELVIYSSEVSVERN